MTNTQRPYHIAAYLYFVALMLAISFPLVTVFSTAFIGDAFSDAHEYARHIWWISHALQTGAPVFDQPLLAYPDGLNGAWLWGNPFQSFPAWLFALVMPLPAAYNLGALLHLALNGWAAYFLVWRLTYSRAAALLAGTVFAIYPTVQGHLIASHTGLLVLWGLPLTALALYRLGHTRARPRDIALALLAFIASILGNNLLLVYGLFPIFLVFALVYLTGRNWRALRALVLIGVLGGTIALIFVGPVALEQLASPLPSEGGDVRFSADLLAIFAPSFYNPLYTDLTYSRSILGGVN
ncbi:MAG: hypothetical protein AAF125_26045, partial [Chloroflexota bacterium]